MCVEGDRVSRVATGGTGVALLVVGGPRMTAEGAVIALVVAGGAMVASGATVLCVVASVVAAAEATATCVMAVRNRFVTREPRASRG